MDGMIFLAAPVALTLMLVAIHAYLGLHVLERDVVFVDISLSQVAALGGALSLLYDNGEKHDSALWYSLTFCIVTAFILAAFRKFEKRVSQEAIIGITYALASGLLILIMDRLPHGGEHLKTALVGNILFSTWEHVFETGFVYLFIGIIHFVFREKFWATSRGESDRFFWDFLFYLLFGIVITFSTHHAGVLVVFTILIVPAALAKRIATTARSQLLIAWALGILGVLAAFALTWKYDLPAGAGIVSTLATMFFVILTALIVHEKVFQQPA
jgi:zinc/manganese transport system permease protein